MKRRQACARSILSRILADAGGHRGARPKPGYGMCGAYKHRRARRIALRYGPAFATHHEINERPTSQQTNQPTKHSGKQPAADYTTPTKPRAIRQQHRRQYSNDRAEPSTATQIIQQLRIVFNDYVFSEKLDKTAKFLKKCICQLSKFFCRAFLWIFPKPFVGKFLEIWTCHFVWRVFCNQRRNKRQTRPRRRP